MNNKRITVSRRERAKRHHESLREIDEVLERYDVEDDERSRAELVAGACEASASANIAKRVAEGERDRLLDFVAKIRAITTAPIEKLSDDTLSTLAQRAIDIAKLFEAFDVPKPVDPDDNDIPW